MHMKFLYLRQNSALKLSSERSAIAQQKAFGSVNPVAAVFAAQTQNTRVFGNGVHATSLLSEAWVLVSEKAIGVFRAAEEENAWLLEKSSRKSIVMLKMHGKLTVTAVQQVQL